MGLKAFCRGQDNVGSNGQGLLFVNANGKRLVVIIGILDHAGDPDKIDPMRKVKSTGNRRTGKDEHIGVGIPQMVGDGHGAADMSKTIGVMGVHENIIGGRSVVHVHDREGEMRDIALSVSLRSLYYSTAKDLSSRALEFFMDTKKAP